MICDNQLSPACIKEISNDLISGPLLQTPQTMVMFTLIVMEALKALLQAVPASVSPGEARGIVSAVALRVWRQSRVLMGVFVSLLFNIFIVYNPIAARLLGLRPITADQWKVRIIFSISTVLFG